MAKRISISIPDGMYDRLQELKEDMTGERGKRKISTVCQNALKEVLAEAESSRAYRLEGVKDGKKKARTLSKEDKQIVAKILSKTGSYKFWSKEKKVEKLKAHFEEKMRMDISKLYPRFIQIMQGHLVFHDWVKNADDSEVEDRIGEMAWSYVHGCYEGVFLICQKEEVEE